MAWVEGRGAVGWMMGEVPTDCYTSERTRGLMDVGAKNFAETSC